MFYQTLAIIFLLLTLHELGHIFSAVLLKLKIDKVGFTFKPYPHPYVAVSEVKNNLEYYVFLFSGISVTVTIFLICWWLNLLHFKALYYALAYELVIETNPFHSDFTIAFGMKEKFTLKWYFLFFAWMAIITVMFAPQFLAGYFLNN
jgi:hypothetical protein